MDGLWLLVGSYDPGPTTKLIEISWIINRHIPGVMIYFEFSLTRLQVELNGAVFFG